MSDYLVHKKALKKWGYLSQKMIWIEELAELIQALAKEDRKINGSTKAEIVEELVDVLICTEQMIIYFSDGYNIQTKHKEKFERYRRLVMEKNE